MGIQGLGTTEQNCSMARLAGRRDGYQEQVQALIFNCRLVCRNWNKSIGNLAQEINSKWNWDTKNRDKYTMFQFIPESYEFSSTDEIDKFLNKFKSSIQNPFFGETIVLLVPPIFANYNHVEYTFYEKVSILLNLFGKYVANCQIHLTSLSDLTLDSQLTYLNLIDILWTLPNLKHLSIIKYDNILIDQIENLRTPPTLKKLESLSMHSVSGAICNEIVRNNLQVSTLVIEQARHNLQDAGYLIHPFENLVNLELIWCNWNEIGCLKDFNLNFLKLKTLKLKYFSVVEDNYPDLLDVFNILSTKFGENLEELELAFPEITGEENKSKIVNDMLEFRLELPKVKKIDLTVKNDFTFDFLLGMSDSLESLRITSFAARQRGMYSENYLKAKCNETIQLLSCYDKLYRSNIWKLLPKLKSVELCDGFNFSWSYNRHDQRKTKTRTRNSFKRLFSAYYNEARF